MTLVVRLAIVAVFSLLLEDIQRGRLRLAYAESDRYRTETRRDVTIVWRGASLRLVARTPRSVTE